ncbi:MAG: DUF1385 domain-containing protein [Lachnospiraceae bacterium]|nr:DUF1385 domain-containing protein [Lachnospiraceae bacterium]
MDSNACPISGSIYSGIGGQAVMEGVMMRNKDDYAVAVRRADGEIVVKKGEYHGVIGNKTLYKIPVIRGILSFVDSLVLGMSTLNFSSDVYMQGEEEMNKTADEEPGETPGKVSDEGFNDADKGSDLISAKKSTGDTIQSVIITVVAVILALGLFMVLPYLVSLIFKPFLGEGIVLSLIEGLIRIIIFIAYIKLISMMEDIKRVFMYHGAEHKCINCLEAGLPLTVENVKKASREHRRCGTSFLLYVMVISIIFFAFIQTDVRILKLVMRIILIPVIAGVSYEFIRLAGRSDNPVVKAVSKPGLWLQKMTTREPDEKMIEIGIRSVEEVFDWKEFLVKNFKTSEVPCVEQPGESSEEQHIEQPGESLLE